MMYLVSATPGTGKTCWVVKQLLEWIEQPENKKRKIYANIAGLKIEGIEPPPDDFRNCEDGSIIIYDEAQEIEHYSSDSRANNPIAKALSKHRHRGFDIWFISQDPSLLHKYVLKNIYLHYYLWRPAQRQNVEIFTFARAIVSPTKEDFKNAYDVKWWRFDEYYLRYYTSTVLNTSKKVGSSKRNGIIVTFLIFMAMIAYFIYPVFTVSEKMAQVENVNKDKPTQNQQVSNNQTTQQNQQVSSTPNTSQNVITEQVQIDKIKYEQEQKRKKYLDEYTLEVMNDELLIPASIIEYDGKCKAYNTYGDGLNMTQKQCKHLLANRHLIPRKRSSQYQYQDNQNYQQFTNNQDVINQTTQQVNNASNGASIINAGNAVTSVQ